MIKKLCAVLLMIGMMVSCVVMASAAGLTDLIPRGSNPPATDTDTSQQGSAKTPLGQLVETLLVADAPDNVKEAFGVYANDEYMKSHDYCFAVNTSKNMVIAYGIGSDGIYSKPVKAFVASCGTDKTPTKKGTFKTSDTYRWRKLNGGVYGQWATRITGQYLFHSVPYTKKDPSTLQTAEYNKLGTNASAGCVRLSVKDAKWIQKHCPEGTIVYIYDGSDVREPLAKPTPVKIDVNSPNAKWDPTDPNENNPWNK